VGLALAEQLGRTFLDVDLEIERREGRTIRDIFGEKGELHFRRLERVVTEELALVGHMIVAPGGGWIEQPDVVALVRPPSRLVYLKVRPETALARLGADRVARPLLARQDPAAEMRKLLDSRRLAYSSAEFVVNTELLDVKGVVSQIAAFAATF
jgi:shikimate kinase